MKSAAAVCIASLTLLAAPLTGCGTGARSSVDYSQAYQQGRYGEARDAAAQAAERADGFEAEQARLIQGLAAHAQGDYAEAMLTLRPLAGSTSDAIAGPAGATVGLIHLDRGQFAEAAGALEKAAERMRGEDEVRARAHAAIAYERLGRTDDAARQRRLALENRPAGRVDSSLSHRNGFYAIQLGAFSSRARAASMVETARRLAVSHGLGSPRIELARGSGGEVLYCVRLGEFRSRAEAERLQSRLGVTSMIAEAPID